MARQRTRLSDKDFKLLKKEDMMILGNVGPLFPMFGNNFNDFIKFHVYDMNDTYLKSGVSEDFANDGNNIKLKPGNDLRKVGFVRGNYKVKYFFYRRLAGADEVVLTKTVGDKSGVVHSGDPKFTGIPMGAFYVDEDGKVFQGEKPPVDGSEPSELDVKEYKFFIDEISADRTEVRLATQAINLDNYKDEFNSLYSSTRYYVPKGISGEGGIVFGQDPSLYGKGKFNSIDGTKFQFDVKEGSDLGFHKKYVGGTLEVKNAYVVGYEPDSSTVENPAWNLEDPIPIITIETNYPYSNATTDTPVTFTAKRENGNLAPSQLSYYWNFGCGHKEFGGPEISHRYTKTGNMNVTVVINSPNFVATAGVENPIPIAQGNVLGPLGYTINTFTANGADATFTMAGAIPETAEALPHSLEYKISDSSNAFKVNITDVTSDTQSVFQDIAGLNSGTLTLEVRLKDSIGRLGSVATKEFEGYESLPMPPIANFTFEVPGPPYTLTVNTGAGGNAGIGTAFGPDSAVYDEGTVNTVVAQPNDLYDFSGWTGDGTGTGTVRTVMMDEHKTINAGFTYVGSGEDDSCFIAGTKILMFNGTEKNIENINVGDVITSYEGGSFVSGTVTELLIHPIYDEVEVAIIDKKLIGTPSHPIFYNGKWNEIKDSSIPFILERMYVDNYFNLEVDGFTVHGSEHNYIANGCIVSGFGNNLILNKMFHRQNIFKENKKFLVHNK